jgi:hypothetical protein
LSYFFYFHSQQDSFHLLVVSQLKEQGDLKELVESSIKSNSGQLDVLKSHSSKLEVISSALSVWPKQMQADLKQQQSDIFRIFTKEMEVALSFYYDSFLLLIQLQ